MLTSEIEKVLSSDCIVGPAFGGVYPSNKLPKSVYPGKRLFIANTDPAGKPGEHWVAFYFHPDGHCIYYDSYGSPPLLRAFSRFMENNSHYWIFNTQGVQDINSSLCGFHCIFFAVHICRGMNLSKFLSMFDSNRKFNDLMVYDFVNHYYGDKLSKQKNIYVEQSCCKASLKNLMY